MRGESNIAATARERCETCETSACPASVSEKALARPSSGCGFRSTRPRASIEARGLVDRKPHPEDGRANAFSLTEAGQALVSQVSQRSRAVAAMLLSPLTEAEAETLLRLLARLVDAHELHARPGAGRRPPRRA